MGFQKKYIVKIPKQGNYLTRFILHKQRFFCKNCNNTFIAETSLVEKNKNISNNTDLQIKLELIENNQKNTLKDMVKKNVIRSSIYQ